MPDSRQPRPNPLSNPDFDRAAHRRLDAAWLAATRGAAEARVVPVWQSKPLMAGSGAERRAVLVPASDFDWSLAIDSAFLGIAEGAAHFAADISKLAAEDLERRFGGAAAAEDMRMIGQWLPADEAALLAYAKGLLWWHERHRFCGVCGHRTESTDGGHRRLCTNPACKAEQFPRSDPAVIVLVEHDDRCLLARGSRFPPGFHSVLAGFVEPGESLEDTVAREVFEECGIRVADIAYQSSQPWPFPSSLMLGFRARALNAEFALDPNEILEAGWYTRDWVSGLDPSGSFKIPPGFSISRRLIDDWIAEA
ncbi:MAG TPA: NAD(+) diphosphatase [Alphaproteobacteria bacterium]|nr:NAD(+) diphosphatase [Alphaproteobacteria bacterium]